MPKSKGLTNKQQAFVAHYLRDFNATQAAIRAGYSARTASAIGSENLRKPLISRAIQDHLDGLKVGADEVLYRLGEHARGTMEDFINPDELPEIFKAAAGSKKLHLVKKAIHTKRYTSKGELIETKTEFELYDAQSALGLLGKHHKLFTDRVDHTSNDKELIALTADRLAAADKQAEKELEDWEGDRLGSDTQAPED